MSEGIVIPFAKPSIGEEDVEAVSNALRSGWLTSGKEVRAFEAEFAAKVQAKAGLATNSATSAALILLKSFGVGPGTEVVFPTYTFSGPPMMAHLLGATVVLVDCLPNSPHMDPELAAEATRAETRVVVPTHFGGAACNLKAYVPAKPWVFLVDDAAHSFPTPYNGGFIGSQVSDATFFSFYATKTITTGDGGMITLRHPSMLPGLRKLRQHGFKTELFDRYTNPKAGWEYEIDGEGWKVGMTDFQAALGRSQLRQVDMMTLSRRQVAKAYVDELADYVGMDDPDWDSVWHLFQVKVPNRNLFIAKMAELGVQCSVHFKPLHHHKFWRSRIKTTRAFPHADERFRSIVSLPIHTRMSARDVDHVIEAVKAVVKHNAARA